MNLLYVFGMVGFRSLESRPWIRNKPLHDLHADNMQAIAMILLTQNT